MLLNLNIREDILKYFPNFEYFNCLEPERLDFNRVNNLVGMQQEAFLNFFILKQLKEYPEAGGGLDLGCGQNNHFACIGLNDYYGDNHTIYGGSYYPHITSLAENAGDIFNENTFNFIVASHILEHINEPIATFRKWCKLLRKDGILILIVPDAVYEIYGWDITHKSYFTPEDFKKLFIEPNIDLMRTERFNEFSNKFSFNYVGRRK